MTVTQLITIFAISMLPIFFFIALRDGIAAMVRVLALVLGVCAWVIVVVLGAMKLLP
jgi:hypothetical protein